MTSAVTTGTVRGMWINSEHAAESTREIVARTGSPVEPSVLDAAETVAETLTVAGLPLGSPKSFASTVMAAVRAVEAGRLTRAV